MLVQLLNKQMTFPNPNTAQVEPNGLLAIGGDLSVDRLLTAYEQGIFPWYSSGEPILWWSPDPRAVLDPSQFHVSRSFNKFIKKCDYQITINHQFKSVVIACSQMHGETWITDEMIAAYVKLNQLGFAHSVEVWQNSQLIGGLYGIAQGAIFCGESMFSLQSNASKVALYVFCQHFLNSGGLLLDCQVLNGHTASLGAFDITRDRYLSYLKSLQAHSITENCYRRQRLIYR